MEKKTINYRRMAVASITLVAVSASLAWLTPVLAGPKKDGIRKEVKTLVMQHNKGVSPAKETEETQLVNSLLNDRLIDQVAGFVVEKMHDQLFINGQLQRKEIAGKYLAPISKENIRVQVYSFAERMKQHPDASFIQILFPVQFSSGCVDYGPKKEGC